MFWRLEEAGGLYAQALTAAGAFVSLGGHNPGPGGKGRNQRRAIITPLSPHVAQQGRAAVPEAASLKDRMEQNLTHLIGRRGLRKLVAPLLRVETAGLSVFQVTEKVSFLWGLTTYPP